MIFIDFEGTGPVRCLRDGDDVDAGCLWSAGGSWKLGIIPEGASTLVGGNGYWYAILDGMLSDPVEENADRGSPIFHMLDFR